MVKQMIPTVQWAQDKTRLYFKYLTTDPIQNSSLKVGIESNKLKFQAAGKSTFYNLDFEFNKKVREDSIRWKHGRNVEVMVLKEEKGFWPHPMANGDKRRLKKHVAIDWEKFVDEDDLEDQASPLANVNLPGLPDFLKPHVAKMQAQKDDAKDGSPVEAYVPPMGLLKRLGYGRRTGKSDDEELDWEIEDRRKNANKVRRKFSWRKGNKDEENIVSIPKNLVPSKRIIRPTARKKPSPEKPPTTADVKASPLLDSNIEEEDVD